MTESQTIRRHSLWWVFTCLALMIMPCCTKKTHFCDIEDRDGILVKKGEGVFTGKAWSSDDKTVCMEIEMGRPKYMNIYYDNRRLAGVMTLDEYSNLGNDMSEVFYNKRDESITHEEFLNDVEGKAIMEKALIYLQVIGK